MQQLKYCNFFDLFGINIDGNYVARLNLKIIDKVYEKGFIFEKNEKYSRFIISNYINHFVLIYAKMDYIKIHMFTLNTITKNEMCNVEKEQKLFRFGEFKHIHHALIKGEFLIQSAIYYYMSEHNEARRDNEHIHQEVISKNNVKVFNETQNKEIKLSSDLTQENINKNLNQYILCTSYLYDEKLYGRFGDTCLVVNNSEEFEKRLMLEIERKYPELIGISNRVSYSEKQHHLGIVFTKPISFIEQKEYRFCWRNDNNPQLMNEENIMTKNYTIPKPLKVKIGNIQDIAEIVNKENIICL